MDMDEVIRKKQELQKEIARLLDEFSESTHVEVTWVTLNPTRVYGKSYPAGYLVKIDAEI